MAITFDAASPDTSSNANVSTLTSTAFTVAGSDRVLIAAMGAGAGTPAAHSAMKWGGSGGTAMTQVGASLNIGANARLSAWRLIAPAAASQTLYGEFAAAQDETAIGGTSYTGVDQTTPVGTAVTNTGTFSGSAGFNATITVTTVVGDVVWAAFWVLDGNGNSPLMTPNGTPSGTGRYEVEGAALTFESMQIQEVVATGTSTVVSCAVAPTSGTMTGDWGGIAFVVNSASGAPPPAITSTSTATPQHTGSMTITGTDFGASQGSGSVTIGGVSQTVTSWANTSIDVTVDRGVTKYGVAANVVVIDNALASSSPYALTSITPPTGWSYTDITTPFVYPWLRLMSAPDIASGDQITYESQSSGVTVYADATFSVWNTIKSFLFEVWSPSAWGATALQETPQPSTPNTRKEAADADSFGFISALSVKDWAAAPLEIEKWFADELSASAGGGTDATVSGVTLTATASVIPGSATGQSNATVNGQTLTATASLIPGSATGEQNATVAGQTLTATASLVPGSATGESNATVAGQTLTATASVIAGSVTADSSVAGVTLTATASLIPGSASGAGDATVSGQTLTVTASLIPGSASGTADATVSGQTITATASLIPGGTQADDDIVGQTLTAVASLLAGSAFGPTDATVSGWVLTANASLTAGSAYGPSEGGTVQTGRLALSVSIGL